MAFFKVSQVAIRGISACVPSDVEENINLPYYSTPEEAAHVSETIGIERRHVSPYGVTSSDLCLKAAEKLIEELGWEKDSIDLLAFATQCPDYINHPNSFVVHDRLGLPENTICLDFYSGCPAWVVSLGSVLSMMQSGNIRRALLLDGDTVSKIQDKTNRESRPLFGDAGTATALEFDPEASPVYFNIRTYSEEGKALIVKRGGYREPFTLKTLDTALKLRAGIVPDELLADEDKGAMDSISVFSFAITRVPKVLKRLCSEYGIELDGIDGLYLHQANKFILENIAKRMKLGMDKVPMSLREYGNTTSASIPLTIVSNDEGRRDVTKKILSCGFGTGLECAAAYFELKDAVCPQVVIL